MRIYTSFRKLYDHLTSITGLAERLGEVLVHHLADVARVVGEDDAVGGHVLRAALLRPLLRLALHHGQLPRPRPRLVPRPHQRRQLPGPRPRPRPRVVVGRVPAPAPAEGVVVVVVRREGVLVLVWVGGVPAVAAVVVLRWRGGRAGRRRLGRGAATNQR